MSITNRQINELLTPISDQLKEMAETSIAPAELSNLSQEIEHAIKGDRWEGKVSSIVRIHAKLYLVSTRPVYRFFDITYMCAVLEGALVDAARPEAKVAHCGTDKDLGL